jgi:hypothetical protein
MRRLLFLCLLSGLFFGRFAMPQALSEARASVTGFVTGAEAPIVVFLQSDDKNPTRYYDGYQAAAWNAGNARLQVDASCAKVRVNGITDKVEYCRDFSD